MRNVPTAFGVPHIDVAKDQPQYSPVKVIRANHPDFQRHPAGNTAIMAFQLTADECARLASGQSLYVALLTMGYPQQPIILSAGPDEIAKIFDLPL